MSTVIDEAIEKAGGLAKLSRLLDIAPPSICGWRRRNRVPAGRVLAVEAATNGVVTRHDLRPDLYPAQSAAS